MDASNEPFVPNACVPLMRYDAPQYSIKAVSQLTGLSTHVIRVWERRYNAVTPARTDTNRRLYSDADVDRLRLMRMTTEYGQSIGRVAGLTMDELESQVATLRPSITALPVGRQALTEKSVPALLNLCQEAVRNMDEPALENALLQASRALSLPVLLEDVLGPFMRWVGESWREGSLRIAHEHFASGVTRQFLARMRRQHEPRESASAVVFATLPGQWHEVGLLMAALAAAAEGWRPIYLGANLPVEEIANAAVEHEARAVALSLVYPVDDECVPESLDALRRYLPDTTLIFVGGGGAPEYEAAIEAVGGVMLDTAQSLRHALEASRTVSAKEA